MIRILKSIAAFLIAVAALFSFVGIYLCEGALRLLGRPHNLNFHVKEFASQYHSTVETVEATSKDNLKLHGWYFHVSPSSEKVVLLLHGQGDNRIGMIPYARLFLSQSYNVLIPDMRAHGLSEGKLVTYGLKEASDIQLWVDWLMAHQEVRCVYGLGESMGASILLQSLNVEKRFCAVVAECPFSSFVEIGYDRVMLGAEADNAFGRFLFEPAMKSALIYADVRYDVNLQLVSAENAVKGSRTPILLIHGLNDRNVLPRHSDRISKAAAGPIQLWKVSGAGHTGAISTFPKEFARRVLSWFQSHS